ncbi:nuclear transport factor 2 family protein [Sphingobium sp. LMC3-1-1.1]|uniref:nuclear transport factor 2 family protein n=1 Tax=unclassified Sphingobium TaxID=2611147 RepID=UPI0034269E61
MMSTTVPMTERNLAHAEAIRMLKARYFRNMDQRDWEAMIDVFVDDAVMDMRSEMAALAHAGLAVDPQAGLIEGQPAILQAMSSALVGTITVHHGHMGEIDILSDNEAEGIWPMRDVILMPEGSPVRQLRGYGHYHERYRRVAEGEWRIAHLRLSRLLIEWI